MSTPAGWYPDGSGQLRWWDGQNWTDLMQSAPPAQPLPAARSSQHLWWALSPVYTCCLISFVPAVHAAMKLRRRDLWYWAIALIVGDVIGWVLVGSGPEAPKGATTVQSVGSLLIIICAAIGIAHALRLREAVFGPAPVQPAAPALDPAIADSLAARKRRVETVAMIERDPGLARDLRVGRPDLTRQYDDGGLVDVNHVPESILVSHLGLSAEQARDLVGAREQIGGFESADDLCTLASLPQHDLDAIRDRVVAL